MPPHSPAPPHRLLTLTGVVAVVALCACGLAARDVLSDTGGLQVWQHDLRALQARAPWLFGIGFFTVFTSLSALALPGCSLLALAAGVCFGWVGGTLLVVLASTAGATLSFLAARHLWRDAVRRRWGHRLAPLEAGLARDGVFYLFALRMVPIIPYPLLNPLMGLSGMPVGRFVGVSVLGMLAGSAAFVYAGTALGGVSSWQTLASPPVLWAVAALTLLPLAGRWWWRRRSAAA